MGLSNTLIDNSENLKLMDTINEIIAESKINEICIATGYWDLKGTALITDSLLQFLKKDGTKLKLLIGKDPIVFARDLTAEAYKNAKEYPKDFFKIDLENIDMNDELCQKAAKMLMDNCVGENPKIEVRIFDKNEVGEKQFLHSKCYIFYGSGVAYGIIGSSNFTQKGLEGNSELNYLETLPQMITAKPDGVNVAKGHIFWFNEKWELAKDWTQEFILEISNSAIGKISETGYTILSPYETYIRSLIEEFGNVIDTDSNIKADDFIPHDRDFRKLSYQIDAVNQGYAIMKKHKGFIIADVVGLGKTYTALMVLKRYMLETHFSKPALIITPPAIKQNWIDSIEYFDEREIDEKKLFPTVTLSTIGSLSDEEEDENYVPDDDFDSNFVSKQYGMIIVDESHRFRNNNTKMYQKLDNLIASIAPHPYIVLLSATPQNNRPYDLRNQIYLFEREHNNSTLENLGKFGNRLENYFAEKQNRYEQFIKKDKIVDGKKVPKTADELEADRVELEKDSKDIHACVVEPLIIRRTRSDIEAYYGDDMKAQNLSFPLIKEPQAIPYEMQGELGELFNDTIDIIAPEVSENKENALGYYRYRAIAYLTEKEQKKYEKNNLTARSTSEHLAHIMELMLVKRLESSQSAFKESLHNLKRYTENMIQMWKENRIFVCPDIDVNKELSAESVAKNGGGDEGFRNCLEVIAKRAKKKGGLNSEYSQKDFSKEYIEKLNEDKKLIDKLCKKWDMQKRDPKLSKFILKLGSDFLNKERNEEQKLVIFTECIATQNLLVDELSSLDEGYKIISITAKNRNELKDVIAANFDANYKGEKKNDYNILITTDVLSEGVNLHRANSLVNYDSPWNATRLMQRLGRINRIGTKAKEIFSYNFYPSTLGDNEINLKNRTYVKLQAFHELFGEDSKIYTKDEEVRHFAPVKHSVDTENPLLMFINELKEFRIAHKEDYERLLNVKLPVFTFVLAENAEAKKSFFVLQEKDLKNNKVENTVLYISNGKKSKRVSDAEFFENMKQYSLLLAGFGEKEESERFIEEFKEHLLKTYETEKQERAILLNKKISVQKKDKNEALKKVQSLYENADEKQEALLDDIADAIHNDNSTLIKKVLDSDVSTNGIIERLHTYIAVKKEKKAKIAIGFIVK